MIKYVSLVLGILFLSPCIAGEIVILKNLSGSVIKARIIDFKSGRVKLQRQDGATFIVSMSIFDEASQTLILENVDTKPSPSSSAKTNETKNQKSKVSFKEINEAYSTLSDDSKRQQYDMFGKA